MYNVKTCPLCGSNLSLKQINLKSAVYICEDLKCPYPVGYDCIEVTRDIENIFEKVNSNIESDFNSWVNDFFDKQISVTDAVDVQVHLNKPSTVEEEAIKKMELVKEEPGKTNIKCEELNGLLVEDISGKSILKTNSEQEIEEFLMNFEMG